MTQLNSIQNITNKPIKINWIDSSTVQHSLEYHTDKCLYRGRILGRLPLIKHKHAITITLLVYRKHCSISENKTCFKSCWMLVIAAATAAAVAAAVAAVVGDCLAIISHCAQQKPNQMNVTVWIRNKVRKQAKHDKSNNYEIHITLIQTRFNTTKQRIANCNAIFFSDDKTIPLSGCFIATDYREIAPDDFALLSRCVFSSIFYFNFFVR